MIPPAIYIYKNQTTSVEKSRAVLINPRSNYCTGENLTIQLDMFDYNGNRKNHGGDFFIARIYSPELGASASGKIEDFHSGIYHVHFTLFWVGKVKMSIRLLHPSEALPSLWKARNQGYGNVDFTGTFLNRTHEVTTNCSFQIQTEEKLCEYIDERDGEYFCCIKPDHVPCEAFSYMMSVNNKHSYLSHLEQTLIEGSNIGKEMKSPFESIDVLQCNKSGTLVKEKCITGMQNPFPSGYFLQKLWNPLLCSLPSTDIKEQMDKCLRGKLIFFMGESTLRQWMTYMTENLKTTRFFNLDEKGYHGTIRALDIDRNLQFQWNRHGHPFLTESVYNVKSLNTISQQIDQHVGGPNTIIVITIGHHFRPFPLALFLRRVINARNAVERLLIRSPDTKVIVKSENIREFSVDAERLSDYNGYIQYLTTKHIFQGLNVGFIDAWDMTIAFASYSLHPNIDVVANQIRIFLSYIC
ncbi:NXPE family member 4-like isoform X2 [Ambystoma mexicanum]